MRNDSLFNSGAYINTHDGELVVDSFAGAGGASCGIEDAIGRPVDLAINHDADMLALHELNHPKTLHLPEDIWKVDPAIATRGRPVGMLWASPDCTHFSVAKGGQPRSKDVRGLAWAVVRWAATSRPRVIFLENVREFETWGPVGKDGRVVKKKKGHTFKVWVKKLVRLGYKVEWRSLNAADYGAPTARKRLFLIARCDGRDIVWPDETHGPGREHPYRTAAECIDFSIPCKSIFERKRPLAENTMRRIARGLRKYVIEAEEPFIVTCNHGGDMFRGQALTDPLHTITASSRCSSGLVTPFLSKYHGPRPGDQNGRAARCDEPIKTIDTSNRFALITAFLDKHYGGTKIGRPATEPLSTITERATQNQVVSAHLTRWFGQSTGQSLKEPAPTATAQVNKTGIVAAHLTKFYKTNTGSDMNSPMPTITGGGQHIGEVRAFLIKYYGSQIGQDQSVKKPLDTITSRDRFGLVTVAGVEYQIVDIGLRMLAPAELLRAQFGRFADGYILKGTKTRKIAAIGNSVCPEVAASIVKANYRDRIPESISTIATA